MELALWTSSKKLEIGFEIDIWPHQMVPYVLFWMHNITSHMNGNRVAFLAPFNPNDHKGDALVYNKMFYAQKSERTKGSILTSYIDFGRLALMKANLIMLWILNKEGAMKRFMTDRELELAYDAKIYLPFSDFFFIRRPVFKDATKEIDDQMSTMGATVDFIYSDLGNIGEGEDRSVRGVERAKFRSEGRA